MTSQSDWQACVSMATGCKPSVLATSMPEASHCPSADPITCQGVAEKSQGQRSFS